MVRFGKLLLFGCALALLVPTGSTHAADVIPVACSDLVAKFQSYEKSESRENTLLREYFGKRVQWTAMLQGVNEALWGMDLIVKCSTDSRGADATVSFDGSWSKRLQQLKPGQQVQFTGQLDGYGSNGGFLVKDGALVSGEGTSAPQSVEPVPPRQTASIPAPSENASAAVQRQATTTGMQPGASFTSSRWLFPDSDSRYLTASDLTGLSADQLWIARNEIFARKGFIFKTPKGKQFADSLGSSYSPLTESPKFNKFEQTNIQFIGEYEKFLK